MYISREDVENNPKPFGVENKELNSRNGLYNIDIKYTNCRELGMNIL